MKPNEYLKKTLKINVDSNASYSEIEMALYDLSKIVRACNDTDVRRGAIRKILSLFYSKQKIAKELSLKYLSKIKKYVDEIDTNIVHNFYSTDIDINDMAVKFVQIFPKFFSENDIVFYQIQNSKSKYKKKAIMALAKFSEKYEKFLGNIKIYSDLDILNNLKLMSEEDYFSSLELSVLIKLISKYPCLKDYFKITDELIGMEIEKKEIYSEKVIKNLRAILNLNNKEDTAWDSFLSCLSYIKKKDYKMTLEILKNLQNLDITEKYKNIFMYFSKKLEKKVYKSGTSEFNEDNYEVSSFFDIEVAGLKQNAVYGLLKKNLK